MDQAAMDFHSLTRRELQALCKKNKIPANMTNVAMADALKSLEIVEGQDEITNQCLSPEKTVERAPATASRASTRRKAIKEPQSTQPTTQTRRSTRTGIAESNDGESKNLFGHQTPKVPITATRSRRVIEPLAQCQMESLDVGTEGKKAIFLETPKVLNVQKSSLRRKGNRQEEASAQQVNSSRRSVRLLEKSLENLSLKDKEIVQPEVPTIDQKVEDQVERKDIVSGTVHEDLSPLLEEEGRDRNDNIQHQVCSEDSHGLEKPDQDSEKSGVSDNVAGLNGSNVGCKASDMPDGPSDHLDNNQEDNNNDASPVETSEANFVALEISSTPNRRQNDLLVSESSDMEVLKLVDASLEPVQDENTAAEDVEDLGHEGATMDSEVEDHRALSDDEGSFEKSSSDSEVVGPMQDEKVEEDDAEEPGYEALATKDSAEEAKSGLSDDGDQDGSLLTVNGMTDLMDSFEKSSSDSDVKGPMEYEKVAEDYVEDCGCDEAEKKGSSGQEDQRKLQTEIEETNPLESLEKSFDDSSLSKAKLVSMNEEPNGTSDVAITGPENIECDESVRRESDAYPTSVEDQNEILPNEGDVGYDEEYTHEHMNIAVMPSISEMKNIEAEESSMTCNEAPLICEILPNEGDMGYDEEYTHEHMNIAVMPSISEMKNIEAEESSMTCNEAPLICGMLGKESPQLLQAEKVSNFKTEGSSSPRVLAKPDFPQPTQSLSKKQSTDQEMTQVDQNKENFGLSVKKKENQELGNKSMRCLKKLLAEKLAKLDINDRAKNTEEDERLGKVAAKVRPALQILPDNRMSGNEALES